MPTIAPSEAVIVQRPAFSLVYSPMLWFHEPPAEALIAQVGVTVIVSFSASCPVAENVVELPMSMAVVGEVTVTRLSVAGATGR